MLTNGITPQFSNALLIFTLRMGKLRKFAASNYANITYNAMAYARNINTKNILQNLATNNMLHPLNLFNITNCKPIHLPNRILTLHLNSMLQESISQTFNLHLLRHFTVNGALIIMRNGFPMLNISRELMRTLLMNKRRLMFLLKRKHILM